MRTIYAGLMLLTLASAARAQSVSSIEVSIGPNMSSEVNLSRALSSFASPDIPTCPVANCPEITPVLTAAGIQGVTTKGDQQEWEAHFGIYAVTGRQETAAPVGQKVALYAGAVQDVGAGGTWTLNTDIVRGGTLGSPHSFNGLVGSPKGVMPGSLSPRSATIGYELDFTNWDANMFAGKGAFTTGIFINNHSSFTSTAAIFLHAHMAQAGGNDAWDYGIDFADSRLIKDDTIHDASHSLVSYRVRGVHTTAFDTSQGTVKNAALFAAGQNVCMNALRGCLTYNKDDAALEYGGGSDGPDRKFSIDDNGNVKAASFSVAGAKSIQLAVIAFSKLPRTRSAGTEILCSDCRKPAEGIGSGTGMIVFDDGHDHWVSTAGTIAAN